MSAPSLLDAILQRRSAAGLRAPGPTREQLALLLRAATTVPDHGMLQPYRFVVVEGEARARLGDAIADAAHEARPELSPGLLDKARRKPFAAPTLIVLIAAPRTDTVMSATSPLADPGRHHPAAARRRDVLGQAQTGTGKTAAFALPILARLD
jgi:nitroreductase